MIVSTHPDVRKLVSQAMLDYPWLTLVRGKKHWRVHSDRSQDFIPIPFTPSDSRRVLKNLWTQIRRLAELGLGLIAAKHR